MKAILVKEFGGPDVLKYTEAPVPDIKPDEVLIRVEKTSVNFADIKARNGRKGGAPFIPGLDAAGVIVNAGPEVIGLNVGQRVIAFPSTGSYAEYAAANQHLTFPIPEDMDFETAAACPTVSFLSYKLLADIARIEEGETVLIHAAAGGVGTTAIQLARALGAGKIIGTVGSEEKLEVALQAGADTAINYRSERFAEKVNAMTEGKGADIVLDSVAGWVTEQSLECLAPYGRLVQFGNSGGGAGNIKTSDLHSSCRSVLGFSLGTTRKLRPRILQETAQKVFSCITNGELKLQIGHRFSLEEANRAHELMESRNSKGKILLEVGN